MKNWQRKDMLPERELDRMKAFNEYISKKQRMNAWEDGLSEERKMPGETDCLEIDLWTEQRLVFKNHRLLWR